MTPTAATVLEIERGEVDGVPLYHLPGRGRTTLAISFRVGRADEPIPWTGVTHLLEHLLLFPFEAGQPATNGTTAPFRMTLFCRGTPAECADFLSRMCDVIADPPLQRIHLEVPVLRTEPAHRALVSSEGSGLAIPLALNRYGYNGLGKLTLPELFLRRPDPAIVREWAQRHLVAANAAIWVAGELPEGLAVRLPRGDRNLPPNRWEIKGLQTPTRASMQTAGVAASFVADRGMALRSGMVVLHERLMRSLRVAQGSAYDISHDRILLGGNRQHVSIWIGSLPVATPAVAAELETELDRLARLGPTLKELERLTADLTYDASDPVESVGRLDARVEEELLGDPHTPAARVIAEQRDLTPEAVAAAVTEASRSMLMLMPNPENRPTTGFFPYPGPVEDGLDMDPATTFPQSGAPFDPPLRPSRAYRLQVSRRGAWVAAPDAAGEGWQPAAGGGRKVRRVAAVPWSECVAIVRDPDGRDLLARDGTTISVGRTWRDHGRAIRMIDELGPADRVIEAAPWDGPAAPPTLPLWRRYRLSLLLLAVGAWVTLMWSSASPGHPETIVAGLAFTVVITMLATSGSEPG